MKYVLIHDFFDHFKSSDCCFQSRYVQKDPQISCEASVHPFLIFQLIFVFSN